MKKIFQSLFRKNGYSQVIPYDAPWYFRLNFHGLLTAIRYMRLEKILYKYPHEHDPEDAEKPLDAYDAYQFACIYGRSGTRYLREITKIAEESGVAHKSELRLLIQRGDMRDKGGRIQVNTSLFWLIFSYAVVVTFFILAIVKIYIFSSSSLPPIVKISSYGIYLALFLGSIYAMNDFAFRPNKLAKKLRPDIEKLERSLQKQPSLTVIK